MTSTRPTLSTGPLPRVRAVALLVAVLLLAGAVPAQAARGHHRHPARHHASQRHAAHHRPHHRTRHRPARHRPAPSRAVALRLGTVGPDTRLVPPGVAMERDQRSLTVAAPLNFPSEPLRRAVVLRGRPLLRLHLSHSMPGGLRLGVAMAALGADGGRRRLDATETAVAAGVLSRGPRAAVDTWLRAMPGALLRPRERLQVSLWLPASAGPDVVTVYLGALPGEDPNPNDARQLDHAAKGGSDPARLAVIAQGSGAFQVW